MAAAPSLGIIEITHISPPTGSVPEMSIPLTFFDMFFLCSPPVERLYFYPYKDSSTHFTSSCLPALKSSLSLALRSFFPFAGNIRLAPESTDKYEIHYVDGDSILFVAAESDDHHDLFGDGPREVSKLKILAPNLNKNESDDLQPVLAIQVTIFPYHGLVIGITVHHSVCDGNGSVNFMRTWATICHASNSMTHAPATPILDRSIIPDSDGSIYTAMKNALLISLDNIEQLKPNNYEVLYYTSFTLKDEHVRFLKENFMREAKNRNMTVRCSTVVATYAFVWIGYLKAKFTFLEAKEAYCIFAVDHRQWFQPAIPENYFGNCIGICFIQANVKDLFGPYGFFEACQAISKAFEEAKKIGINDAKDWIKNAVASVVHKPLTAAGSPRFQVYDVDFGLGKPTKVDIISIAYSGAMAVAQSRDEQGGVEIGLSFTQREIEVFKNYFDESLPNTSH